MELVRVTQLVVLSNCTWPKPEVDAASAYFGFNDLTLLQRVNGKTNPISFSSDCPRNLCLIHFAVLHQQVEYLGGRWPSC
jgi:hypothetical protein